MPSLSAAFLVNHSQKSLGESADSPSAMMLGKMVCLCQKQSLIYLEIFYNILCKIYFHFKMILFFLADTELALMNLMAAVLLSSLTVNLTMQETTHVQPLILQERLTPQLFFFLQKVKFLQIFKHYINSILRV